MIEKINLQKKESIEKIKSLFWKPVNIGLIGLGSFGVEVLKYMNKSQDVKTIKIWSQNTNLDRVLDILEEKESSSKIKKMRRLEETLEETDILLITTSTLQKEEAVRLAKSEDRHELFPYEKEKFSDYFRKIKECSFDGIGMIYSNPIGHLLKLGKEIGMNPYKWTSSFRNDTDRLIKSIKDEYGIKDEELKELITKIVGVHGSPKLVSEEDIIKTAENKILKIGHKTQRAAQELKITPGEPQYATLEIIEDFAHYRNPRSNAYCYIDLNNFSGYASLPSEFNFKDMEIKPDIEKIKMIGEDKVYRILEPFLKNQIVEESLQHCLLPQ